MNLHILASIDAQLAGESTSIPTELRNTFAPAQYCLREWKDYWLECPGADALRLGSIFIRPVKGSLFQVRFENQLGLTSIQPYADSQPLSPPLTVEVISRKFPSPEQHLAFFQRLLNDLFSRAARLPFTFDEPTGRSVTEALQPPTPLFILHFLCQFAPRLQAALRMIQSTPHRRLHDQPAFVRLAEASEADADVMISILHTPEELTTARGFPLAEQLHGWAPAHVWQRRSEETLDTPENRFVLSFLRTVLAAAEMLAMESWWKYVAPDRQRLVRELAGTLRQVIMAPLFAEVGVMHYFPAASQVLLRREGYRDVLELWQIFQWARRPLFGAFHQAIEVRDIAKLYEMWVFFALVEHIGLAFGITPVVDVRVSDEHGLEQSVQAHFGHHGTLVYNQSQSSYSVPLRPDFTWFHDGAPKVVLDAKFRLDRQVLTRTEDTPQTSAKRADLYKMHTYRDALKVRAAVSVYPGDGSIFYEQSHMQRTTFSVRDLLNGEWSGIGALALRPGQPEEAC